MRDGFSKLKKEYKDDLHKFKDDKFSVMNGQNVLVHTHDFDKKAKELKDYNRALKIIQDRLKQA